MSYLGMHVVVDVGSGQLPLDLHDFLQSLSDRVGQSNERRFFVVFSPGLTTGRWMAAAGMNRYDQYTQTFGSMKRTVFLSNTHNQGFCGSFS